MVKWKDKFEKSTLDRGKGFYLNQRVVGLEEIIGGYKAAVLGRNRFEVTVKLDGKGIGRMSCICPVARGGKTCDHMAAVLYAIEAKEELEQDRQAEKMTEAALMEKWRQLDEEVRKAEEQKKLEEVRRKREKQEAKVRRQKEAKAAAQKEAEEKMAKEEQLRQEEVRRQEEEKAAQEAKAAEEARAAESEKRRLAREARKAERQREKEEQKRQAEEARRIEAEKRQAEEARREAIRKQKAEDARRRTEKKQKEQEEAKRLAEKRKKEQEEAERLAAKQKKEQEEKRLEEQRKKEQKDAKHSRTKRREAYTLLGDSWAEDAEASDTQNSGESIAKLEKYNYFDGSRIRKSVDMTKKVLEQGRKLLEQGKINLQQVASGYEQFSGEIMGQIDAVGKDNSKGEFTIRILFSRTEVSHAECRCISCRRDYYAWYAKKVQCPYKAGLLLLLEDFLSTHNIGDATDRSGQSLLHFYQKKRANHVLADVAAKEESLKLAPRLIKKEGKLTASFKIGEKKLFVVKKLDDFCRNVKTSATDIYGSNTEINHSLENFTQEGRGWIHFISRIVREEEEFQQRLLESRNYYSYKKSGVGSELNLFGWRLDEFFEQMADTTVEFEDKDGAKKKKDVISCAKHNPKVTMDISAEKVENDSEFHGIMVKGSLPDMFFGTDTAYYIGNHHLNRVDAEFLEKIEPLTDLAEGGRFSFSVGRNYMSEFYHTILPQLQDIVDITETEPEKFRSYLPPEVRFTFYLDAEDQNVSCSVFSHYGDKEFSVLELLRQGKEHAEPFRDFAKEDEVLFYTKQLFPEIDWEHEELHCGGDEDLVYEVMEHGTERLMELGEVRCTKRFLGFHAVKSVKVSVGVSVSAGLLELDIATEDVPKEELLDILNSYRTKKKYYRLKDGSFVNLEDSSLEMLAELMDTAHIKPKEFVKGKMHLPMYRTLYLDKMLEENEAVYSNRDSHFREVVKGFKTIQDADFEEPKSLSKVMRKYQKNGYKWLRTLENWQFGGILADDMGLGKTLQVIAVLLAAKQEGKEGTSLVVSPASLVYNWGAEFEKFAPELNISLITGTQEERQDKIEAWQEADVLVTSYDLLKRDILFYEEKQFEYQIIDEAQYIKNHTTAAAKAVKIINSRIRYALTGTPIENRLSELWSIFDYLMPGFLYGYDVFKREMESPIVKSGDETALKRLQKMVGPFVLRRLKEDVLKDLPEKLEECRYVRFSGEQRKLYDGQVVHMREHIASQNAEEFNKNKMLILAELTKLRQICCDPALCFENYKGGAAKLEACADLIQSAIDGGHRMLVFSQFTSMLDILQEKLTSLGIPYYTIIGSTSKEKRLALVKEFNEGDVPVFLISLKAGGVGLNLIGADMVIHYDPWWNLAVQNQATDRAHRIGQRKKVTVYKLIAKNTIEEKIQKLQEMKKSLADQVIGGDVGQLGSLSREEILELLEV